MIVWINGAFGAGKTTAAYELHRRLPDSYVYDPENFGYFLRENTPPACGRPDFQDIPLWREGNYQVLKLICRQFSGTVIIPMTLANAGYEREILGRLEQDGVLIHRFVLETTRETLLRRLKKRSLGRLSRERFAVDAMDRCLAFFAGDPRWTGLPADNRPVEEIVEELGRLAGLPLLPDHRRGLQKKIHRLTVLLRHIRP